MTSEAQIRANRRNARRSTGPKSEAGKKRISRNALKHGLAIPLSSFKDASAEVESLVSVIAKSGADRTLKEIARKIAEAQVDIKRVRKARVHLFGRPIEETDWRPVKPLVLTIKGGDTVLGRRTIPVWDHQARTTTPSQVQKQGEGDTRKQFDEIRKVGLELLLLDRYERRALSRRKKAIQLLENVDQPPASTRTTAGGMRKPGPTARTK